MDNNDLISHRGQKNTSTDVDTPTHENTAVPDENSQLPGDNFNETSLKSRSDRLANVINLKTAHAVAFTAQYSEVLKITLRKLFSGARKKLIGKKLEAKMHELLMLLTELKHISKSKHRAYFKVNRKKFALLTECGVTSLVFKAKIFTTTLIESCMVKARCA